MKRTISSCLISLILLFFSVSAFGVEPGSRAGVSFDEQETLNFIKKDFPEAYDSIAALKAKEPFRYWDELLNYKEKMDALAAGSGKITACPSCYEKMEQGHKKPAQDNLISSSDEQRILEFARQDNPSGYNTMLKLKKENPQLYRQNLFAYKRQMDSMEALKKNTPEVYEKLQKAREALAEENKILTSLQQGKISKTQAKKQLYEVKSGLANDAYSDENLNRSADLLKKRIDYFRELGKDPEIPREVITRRIENLESQLKSLQGSQSDKAGALKKAVDAMIK